MDDADVSLPKATLKMMIKELMPDLRCNPDTVDLLVECCTEFVHLLSSESNDISNKEHKNTIHPEHVIQALHDLGFGEFIPEVKSSWEHFKTSQKNNSKQKKQHKQPDLSDGELIAMQRKLLDDAKARSSQYESSQELADRMHSDERDAPMNSVVVLSMPLSHFEIPKQSMNLEDLPSPFGQMAGRKARARCVADVQTSMEATEEDGSCEEAGQHRGGSGEGEFVADVRRSDAAMSIDETTEDQDPEDTDQGRK